MYKLTPFVMYLKQGDREKVEQGKKKQKIERRTDKLMRMKLHKQWPSFPFYTSLGVFYATSCLYRLLSVFRFCDNYSKLGLRYGKDRACGSVLYVHVRAH